MNAVAAVPQSKLSLYTTFARPITILMPMVGFFSGAVTAWGSAGTRPSLTPAVVLPILFGTLMAGMLNAASNAINQIYDLAIDRVNKPKRPLPSGAITMGEAWTFTMVCYVIAWALAWFSNPPGGAHECFWI